MPPKDGQSVIPPSMADALSTQTMAEQRGAGSLSSRQQSWTEWIFILPHPEMIHWGGLSVRGFLRRHPRRYRSYTVPPTVGIHGRGRQRVFRHQQMRI